MENALTKTVPLPSLLQARAQAIGYVKDMAGARERLNGLLDNIERGLDSNHGPLREINIEESRKLIDACYWKYLISRTQYCALMSRKAEYDFREKLDKEPPEFDEQTVTQFVQNIRSLYHDNAEELVKSTYNHIIGATYHGAKSFKKNNLRRVEVISRIIGNIVYDSYYDDLLRVCLLLDGKPVGYGFDFRFCAKTQLLGDDTVTTDYFEVQAFKNGNNRLKWTRLDILEKFNRVGPEGARLTDSMSKRYKPEHFGNCAMSLDDLISKYTLPQNDTEGFYCTPAGIADFMIALLHIEEGMTVLDPSAGDGGMISRLRAFKTTACEYNRTRYESMMNKNLWVNGVHCDFIAYAKATEMRFDRIIMNPPFEKYNSIAHVAAAFKLLKPGGKLAAIMPVSVLFRGDRYFSYFREHMLHVYGVEIEAPGYYDGIAGIKRDGHHPKAILLESSAFESTGVSACIVCFEKPMNEVKQ